MFADLLFGRMPTLPKGRLRLIKETPPTYNGGPDEPSARKHGDWVISASKEPPTPDEFDAAFA